MKKDSSPKIQTSLFMLMMAMEHITMVSTVGSGVK